VARSVVGRRELWVTGVKADARTTAPSRSLYDGGLLIRRELQLILRVEQRVSRWERGNAASWAMQAFHCPRN
jgi:hypothetical protein